MIRGRLIPLLAIFLASPAHAEKLSFDYRLYPALEAVLNSGRKEMLRYDDHNPKYITDRIAVTGPSVDDTTEALDIIVRMRGKKMSSPADWAREIQRTSRSRCASNFTTIAEDTISLTFERQSTGCAAGTPVTGLYRIVAGRRSLFLLNAFTTAAMPETARRKWLALLASAHLEP